MKLIAEPWDCGPGGYQVGAFPPGWAEWNDQYPRHRARLLARRGVAPADLRRACTAPADMFNTFGRQPYASVNFITAHDGFTLNDLVSYNEQAQRGERRGQQATVMCDNRSWNCGAEGPTDDRGINALRERQMRNLLATLLLSQGTPMLLAGDEFAPHAAGQQQRLLPGQRHQLGGLDARRTQNDDPGALRAAR